MKSRYDFSTKFTPNPEDTLQAGHQGTATHMAILCPSNTYCNPAVKHAAISDYEFTCSEVVHVTNEQPQILVTFSDEIFVR